MPEPEIISTGNPDALVKAQSLLRAGELVVIPTDTVYGLAANPWNGAAVSKLYAVKDRSALKAVPILLAGVEMVGEVAQELSPRVYALAARFWPGALTLVVPRRPELPDEISADENVGIRVPDHAFALALLRATGPLAVTSANRSGKPSSRTAHQVLDELNGQIKLVIDGGETSGQAPSTVVDCTVDPPDLLRDGPVAYEAIAKAWDSAGA